MNLEQLKRNKGWRVQLVPIANRLDEEGRELPPENDDWIIEEVSASGLRMMNTRTQHQLTLGADHIHHFVTNPHRSIGGIQYGFLVLHVQVSMDRKGCSVHPNARPGESVRPQPIENVEKWVDLRYPFDSGIQQRLESQGYTVKWCRDDKLSRKIDLEGWEIVVEPDDRGIRSTFRIEDRPTCQTLIKTKSAVHPHRGPTSIQRCLKCGQQLYVARRGETTLDTIWLCSNPSCLSNERH